MNQYEELAMQEEVMALYNHILSYNPYVTESQVKAAFEVEKGIITESVLQVLKGYTTEKSVSDQDCTQVMMFHMLYDAQTLKAFMSVLRDCPHYCNPLVVCPWVMERYLELRESEEDDLILLEIITNLPLNYIMPNDYESINQLKDKLGRAGSISMKLVTYIFSPTQLMLCYPNIIPLTRLDDKFVQWVDDTVRELQIEQGRNAVPEKQLCTICEAKAEVDIEADCELCDSMYGLMEEGYCLSCELVIGILEEYGEQYRIMHLNEPCHITNFDVFTLALNHVRYHYSDHAMKLHNLFASVTCDCGSTNMYDM